MTVPPSRPSAGTVSPGPYDQLGATVSPEGVDFAVYAKRATGLDLLLFDTEADTTPSRVITLDPLANRTADYWHVRVPGIVPGQLYGYAASGPWDPDAGLRFDPHEILLDPYGRGVALAPTTSAMKSVVVDPSDYDWEGDQPLGRSLRQTIIYEAHLAGFTADPNSGVAADKRGTYAGFIEKIPYLVDLGITAVELMPVFAFDPRSAPEGLVNYWGYQPVGFFAPHQPYASRPGVASAVGEFRDLVKALHRAGLEVILDVVFNHTAEAGADGQTISFRGLANDDYYLLGEDADYLDYTGCGNTLNTNGPIVRRLIVDSLRYWVEEMHVDGFRFDLAAVFSRDETGQPMADSPTLRAIETEPALAGTKLIAEAWDAAGLYQVGTFAGGRWSEWNGRFRDDLRSFLRGDPGMVPAIMDRFLGSPDIYGDKDSAAGASINFVTAHDGFTLNDLVSYEQKHNEANREHNRDGSDHNLSWNGGVEGPTDDPEIERLRRRQIRNFLALDLLAVGTPMLLMGDEVRRTQGGNNNAYAHSDPSTWFDWSGLDRHADIHRFTKGLIQVRRTLATVLGLSDDHDFLDLLRDASYQWNGVAVGQPHAGDESHSVALTVQADRWAMYLIFNAYWEPLDFELPVLEEVSNGWQRIVDTSLESPEDIVPHLGEAPIVGAGTYLAAGRSVILLVARQLADPASRGSDG